MMNSPLSSRYSDTLAWIDAQHDNMVHTLIDWANLNSGSYHLEGVARYRDVLHQSFNKLLDHNDLIRTVSLNPFSLVDDDGQVIEQSVADGLLIRKRPECQKRVLLCGHLDTVYPQTHPFQRCTLLDPNTLNGPGVADMKGGILIMRTALEALERNPCAQHIGWDVYLSPDEEIGSQSSAPIFTQFKDNTFAMIYEPSLPDGAFVGERKGSGNFTIVVRGQAAHAGRAFYDGRNAIVKMAHIISDLYLLNDPNQPTTLNIAKTLGGQALNVVPELAIMHFNIRVASNTDAQNILHAVDQILSKHQEDGYQITRHGNLTRPPKPYDAQQQNLFALLKRINIELNLPHKIINTGGCCDGNNLKSLGIANIDTLGVRGGHIHSAQEYALLDSLTERTKLSTLLLLAFANGEHNLITN